MNIERTYSGAPWEQHIGYGWAHGEAFGAHPPATTMVQITALIDPAMMIEIETEALLRTTNDT